MIKVWYCDFWGGFDPYDTFFSRTLLSGLNYRIDSNSPDIVIHSCFGDSYKRFSGKKVCWLGENVRPDFINNDLVLGFDFIDHPKYIRMPLYVQHYWNVINEWKFGGTYEDALLRTKPEPVHTKFCAFIYGNGYTGVNHWGINQDGVEKRIRFFNKLNDRKRVDSMGSLLNNTGFHVSPEIPKINCISDYKFTFAIENSAFPGYVTEKIMDPMIAHSIPIYWGSDRIREDFQGGYVNLHDFPNEDDAVEYILELDADMEKYKLLYNQSFLDRPLIESKYFDLEQYRKKIIDLCV